MVNVLFVVNSFHPGGTERQAVELARQLSETGRFCVRLATLNSDGALARLVGELEIGAVPEYPLRSFYDVQMVQQLARCAMFIRRHRIHIVHTHGFYPNVFGLFAATLARAPIRIASKYETVGCRTTWQRRTERMAFRFAHAIVANCQAVGRQLVGEGVPARRVVTIHRGIEPGRVTPQTRERAEALAMLGLPPRPRCKYVTLVANMRLPVKDHATFLRAARRVRGAVADARFLIAGDGDLVSEMQAFAASLGLDRDVVFLGHIDRIAELLFVSDVCVLSSIGEGFPNAILEYMMAGCPVVATDVGGIAEAVEHGRTGLLVAARDDRALADGIIALLEHPERARDMAASARAVVLESFSAARQLEQTVSLYESALRRGRPSGASSR